MMSSLPWIFLNNNEKKNSITYKLNWVCHHLEASLETLPDELLKIELICFRSLDGHYNMGHCVVTFARLKSFFPVWNRQETAFREVRVLDEKRAYLFTWSAIQGTWIVSYSKFWRLNSFKIIFKWEKTSHWVWIFSSAATDESDSSLFQWTNCPLTYNVEFPACLHCP